MFDRFTKAYVQVRISFSANLKILHIELLWPFDRPSYLFMKGKISWQLLLSGDIKVQIGKHERLGLLR